MNFKFTISTYFFIIISLQVVSAQDSSFHIKDYKFRTLGFRALQLDINLNGNSFNSKQANSSDSKSRSFNTSPGIDYFRIISTDKRQHQSSIFIRPSYNSSYNSNVSEIKDRNFGYSSAWNRTDRLFVKNNFFFEVGNSLNSTSTNNRILSINSEVKNGFTSIRNTFSFGVGKGRLENVQDAQMALFIASDLQKIGLLNKQLNKEEMNELSKLITQINNVRVFDNRIRRIYELSKIDSFFKAHNLVNNASIAYFTTVNDNWALSFNPGRLSGTQFYFRLRPSIEWTNQRSDQTNTLNFEKRNMKNFIYAYEPVIGLEIQKPTSLQWQQSMGASFSFLQEWQITRFEFSNTSNPNEQLTKNNNSGNGLLLNSFYGIGYYPNNRTVVNLVADVKTYYTFKATRMFSPGFQIEPGFFLNANYFLNFRTRLIVNANSSYLYYRSDLQPNPNFAYRRSNWNSNISIGFSHFIL